MDIRALRYFVELVKCQSFTRAADALFVTQPTISKMVKQLEEELDMPLILREGRSFRLTDAGRVTYERGLDVLSAMNQLKHELADLASLSHGELVVGLPPMVGVAFFAPVVSRYRRRYPQIELKMVEDGALAIENRIKSGELEIGVAVLPVDSQLFEHYSVVRDPLCLVAPAGSRWRDKSLVQLADIADQPLVLYPDDFTLSRRVGDAFRELGKTPNIVGRSAHWDFIVELVAANLGVTLLPRSIVERLDRQLFDVVPLYDHKLYWHLALIWQRGGYLSHAARAWLALTRETLGGQD
ncbi:LysR family transcriptional regulator [Chromobacterium violaceum]|uniref:Probable transcriptional activator, LysR family n=1 Tax=Chromobacterium violaceum (strain ATCC 12472 / DSM 30191 / JCM 1249 / CCUG 213 / NBRC 12614 / NCIMB 9131 / NCTC 9757 / MK) TaxID=243365 RepID=Q7NYX2_CHRVO|nr:LysR family transcriptional regulator [Chromobacterium violaceum]AAQ58825.1 probable transcriptional activator, LysR family [Chromobacterium violaceum ATCC 12472]KJH65718.1 LysR family transcriptional regulator [Chromobacterium violaceum]MBP4046704.1 LysR family transcriptional regulator [Chromobacterium violaceum]MBP4050536.1 LysR family transcriptional regulator [Chromobacterium violaceum]OQS24409.1 LysR family transcriptional regulator [Chromobacterium violaceum]